LSLDKHMSQEVPSKNPEARGAAGVVRGIGQPDN
jgi:hypothetical protein